MRALHNRRRASRENVTISLAMPPGFRKVFQAQKIDTDSSTLFRGEVAQNAPIMDTDPTSATFGEFFFMVGYD